MNRETLKKANNLIETIDACDDILKSIEDTYYWCLISVDCANSNSGPKHYATIPRNIWNQMLESLKIQRDKLEEEFNNLSIN